MLWVTPIRGGEASTPTAKLTLLVRPSDNVRFCPSRNAVGLWYLWANRLEQSGESLFRLHLL